MSINIPEGMSSVNAFDALYQYAHVVGMGIAHPSAGQSLHTPVNAIQIFHTYCRNGHCDYVRGKLMKVTFLGRCINISAFDKHYGEGSALKAFAAYQKKLDPKNEFSLECKPCDYFTAEFKEGLPKDAEPMYNRCQAVKREVEKEKVFTILDQCTVRYALTSLPCNYIGFDFKPCDEALKHLKMLGKAEDTTVEGFTVCRFNQHFPQFKKCTPHGDTTVDAARNHLEELLGKNNQ